jgi:hypothetical protein
LAQLLLPDSNELYSCAFIGSSHDIGKTCILLEILKKRIPLTKTEHKYLRPHTMTGYVLLSYSLKNYKSFIARLAREHHERRDRSVYPTGLDKLTPWLRLSQLPKSTMRFSCRDPIALFRMINSTALEEMTKMAECGAIGWDVVRTFIARNCIDKPNYKDLVVPMEKRGSAPIGNLYGKTVDG